MLNTHEVVALARRIACVRLGYEFVDLIPCLDEIMSDASPIHLSSSPNVCPAAVNVGSHTPPPGAVISIDRPQGQHLSIQGTIGSLYRWKVGF